MGDRLLSAAHVLQGEGSYIKMPDFLIGREALPNGRTPEA